MEKIRLGIIGIGRMGITHYSIINEHPRIQIVAVVEPSQVIVGFLRKFVRSLNVYSDYKQLFKKELLDAIIVCTPPGLNHSVILEAGRKGIAVFAEKPFVVKKAEALELTTLFSQNKIVNQVGYVNRFNDIFIKVKEMVELHLIGEIISFKSEMNSRTILKPSNDASGWRSSPTTGGGALFEIGSHAIDLIVYFLGKPDKVVGSFMKKIYSKNVEDAVVSTFLYKDGMVGTLNINWSDESYRKPSNQIELFGTFGKIIANQYGIKLFLKEGKEKMGYKAGWNSVYITDVFKPVPFYVRGNEFTAQLYHFVECVLDNSIKNICSFTDAVSTLEVIENINNDFMNNGKL